MKAGALAFLALLLSVLPACAQDWAKQKIEASPRHLEWVDVKRGARTVKCFIAYPETREKATAVVVIHEIFGLSDWVREVADQLAAGGFIAIAPDLLSGSARGGGGTAELGGPDEARKAISTLPSDQITGDLKAVKAYVSKLPASNGKVCVAGFCWGGGQTFRYATNDKTIKAALVFYGTAPDKGTEGQRQKALKRIDCPVYGFYGEKDARVNATIAGTTAMMKKAEKRYEPVIYEGAGHGFMRAAEAPDASVADRDAREKAWARLTALLKGI